MTEVDLEQFLRDGQDRLRYADPELIARLQRRAKWQARLRIFMIVLLGSWFVAATAIVMKFGPPWAIHAEVK